MSTNATFIKPNSDDSFSIRYHHWDGYADGLGEFLSDIVNTQQKVDWLFDLNCGFSTIMRSKPDEHSHKYAQDEYAQDFNFDWPKIFTEPQAKTTYISTMDDPQSWSNSEQWSALEKWSQEFNYIWVNGGWNLVLQYGSKLSQCVSIDVPSFIQFTKMLSDLELESDEIEFSWEYFAKKMNCSKPSAKRTIQEWQNLSLTQRTKIFEFCLSHDETNFVEQLDSWMVNQKLHQSIAAQDVVGKKKKL